MVVFPAAPSVRCRRVATTRLQPFGKGKKKFSPPLNVKGLYYILAVCGLFVNNADEVLLHSDIQATTGSRNGGVINLILCLRVVATWRHLTEGAAGKTTLHRDLLPDGKRVSNVRNVAITRRRHTLFHHLCDYALRVSNTSSETLHEPLFFQFFFVIFAHASALSRLVLIGVTDMYPFMVASVSIVRSLPNLYTMYPSWWKCVSSAAIKSSV